jgi:malonyl-CoA/methylmalonyl-CoA synthetase
VTDSLFPPLGDPPARDALEFAGGAKLGYGELRRLAAAVARRHADVGRVAIWAEPGLDTMAAFVAWLAAGKTVVPINPRAGATELRHVLSDSAPELLLASPDAEIPDGIDATPIELGEGEDGPLPDVDPGVPGLVVYTSGTTGPPKGVVLSRRALAANLDALAGAWAWTDRDTVVHALPIFHIHGLVLGVLGPVRRGGASHHLGRLEPAAVRAAFDDGGTMMFGVPTMYQRLADAASEDSELGVALGSARLLVSGSAALPAREHERIQRLTGQRIVERYGLSETLIVASVRADGDRRPGYVGLPLGGVDVRLVDESGVVLQTHDDETSGEVHVRGASLFDGYLNRADATAAAFTDDGWFKTGDLATRAADGYLRLIGRIATDLIKSGGFKIGAGEIEAALLEHPAVAEAAVAGVPDDDLGERVVAWVVRADDGEADGEELIELVATQLAPHKRPREVRFVDELPRNALGKVQKRRLLGG